MDDSELVEFLLNDDFNKEKILLSQSLEVEQKETVTSSSGSKVPDDDNRDSKEAKKEVKVSKQISHTELEFLDDLDSIIMSTNKNTTSKNKKSDTKKHESKNESQKKNKKDAKLVKKEEPSSKPLSVLEKLNNRLEKKTAKKTTKKSTIDHNVDSSSLLEGNAQRRIKLGNRTVLVTLQFLNSETDKVEEEKHIKVRGADSLTLTSDASKAKEPAFTNAETLTELLNPGTDADSKDSFKFDFNENNTNSTIDTTTEEKSSRRKRKGKKNTKKEASPSAESNNFVKNINVDKSVAETSSTDDDNPKKVKNRKRNERKRRARESTKSKDGNRTSNDNDNASNKENISPDNNRKELKENDLTEKEKRSSKKSNKPIQNPKEVVAENASSDDFKRTTIEF